MYVDKDRFENARNALNCAHERFNIGTYKERSQHLFLKMYYEPDTSFHEISFNGHITDIKNNDGIIEIQTSGFKRLIPKLCEFTKDNKVKIVYPCPAKSRVCWIDPKTGGITYGTFRTYPKKAYRLLTELLHIKEFLDNKNVSIDIVYTSVSDMRLLNGYGEDRKKRAEKIDIIPEEIIDIKTIDSTDDLREILPFESGQALTNKEISQMLSLKGRNLWMAVKLLCETGIIYLDKKIKNKNIYIVAERKV